MFGAWKTYRKHRRYSFGSFDLQVSGSHWSHETLAEQRHRAMVDFPDSSSTLSMQKLPMF